MYWVVSFIVSWILLLLLLDKSNFKRNVFGGLLALVLATIVDWGGQQLNLYKFHDVIIPWFGCSIFYKFGPVFTMGILYSQSIPDKRWLQVLNILVFTLAYASLEYITISAGVAQYLHWHILASILLDILAFCTLTWFNFTFLQKRPELLKTKKAV